jgi:hypothetical protein
MRKNERFLSSRLDLLSERERERERDYDVVIILAQEMSFLRERL